VDEQLQRNSQTGECPSWALQKRPDLIDAVRRPQRRHVDAERLPNLGNLTAEDRRQQIPADGVDFIH
jgi:hypothetical protein